MITLILIQLNLIAMSALIFTSYKLVHAHKYYKFKDSPANDLQVKDLPSVSVCLPARNETGSMTECLESVLASDYPKIEIIVLDDESSDNTSNLIKAFAHSGVRFVQGSPLPDGWLGKNYALHTLMEEASGQYILFMDVDTRLSVSTISKLVDHAVATGHGMVSVIPQRYDTYRPSAWLGTLRFFWEIVLGSARRPGSSAALWMVKRRALGELQGFAPLHDQVQPEAYIARDFASKDSYSLVVSNESLGVSFAKKWSSQVESSRRMLLPTFYNSTASAFVGGGIILSIILSQAAWVVLAIEGNWPLFAVEFLLGIMLAGVAIGYFRLSWKSRWIVGVIFAPIVAWQELLLLVSSAVGYKTGTITWKGRPIKRPTKKSMVDI